MGGRRTGGVFWGRQSSPMLGPETACSLSYHLAGKHVRQRFPITWLLAVVIAAAATLLIIFSSHPPPGLLVGNDEAGQQIGHRRFKAPEYAEWPRVQGSPSTPDLFQELDHGGNHSLHSGAEELNGVWRLHDGEQFMWYSAHAGFGNQVTGKPF